MSASPDFDNGDLRGYRAGLVNQILTVCLCVTLVLDVGAYLGHNVSASALIIGILWFAVLLCCKWLLKSGRLILTEVIITVVFFVVITGVNISLGTIRAPFAAFYVFWASMVGLLFGLPGILLATVASSLAVLGLILAENAGSLPKPDYSVGITQWITSKLSNAKRPRTDCEVARSDSGCCLKTRVMSFGRWNPTDLSVMSVPPWRRSGDIRPRRQCDSPWMRRYCLTR